MQRKGSQEGGTLKSIRAQGYENAVSAATLEQGCEEQGEMRADMGSAGLGGFTPQMVLPGGECWGRQELPLTLGHFSSHCVACCPC